MKRLLEETTRSEILTAFVVTILVCSLLGQERCNDSCNLDSVTCIPLTLPRVQTSPTGQLLTISRD